MTVVDGQLEAPAQQRGAARGIQQPARRDMVLAIGIDVMHLVRGAMLAHVEAPDRGAVAERDAASPRFLAEKGFEDAAVDLVARRRQDPAHAQFGGVLDVVAPVGEEIAQAELADVRRVQVFAQAQRVVEIVRTDLHRRLADLVRRRRQRVPVALQHQDVHLRKFAAQLQRQAQAGQAAAEDHRFVHRVAHAGPGLRECATAAVHARCWLNPGLDGVSIPRRQAGGGG